MKQSFRHAFAGDKMNRARRIKGSPYIAVSEEMRARIRKAYYDFKSKYGVSEREFGIRVGYEASSAQSAISRILGEGLAKPASNIERNRLDAWAKVCGVATHWLEADNEPHVNEPIRERTKLELTPAPEVGAADTMAQTKLVIENLFGAEFSMPGGNFNPEQGRILLLDALFGSYAEPALGLWEYSFHLDRCTVHVNANIAHVITDEKQKQVESKGGDNDKILVKRVNSNDLFRRYAIESAASKQHLKGDYEIELCLIKGMENSVRARVRAAAAELAVKMNTGGRALSEEKRQRVLDQWVKLQRAKGLLEPDGCIVLAERVFE